MRFPSLSFLFWLLLAGTVSADPGADFFIQKVRPILASHCFKCHGPDEHTRKAKLRLDVREEALKPARSRKRALVPGKPQHSELIARIFSQDETEVMPPPSAKIPLSSEQKQILQRWVADGAPYAAHWAFLPPRRPPLPSLKDPTWPRHPLDTFILAKLEQAGLRPSPEADRPTLIRRLYLDLLGFPPTVDEVDAFLADSRPDAYFRLVDQLLASPAYGERWARRWLDLARYADTNGYEKDRPRSIWPYRDWVIQALNDDMPFDRFSIEQLAGDMLPHATLAQRIATGFHRNTMLNEEGGIDPLEFRFHAMTDRVATTGTVWLGLTLGCAQCHSHKYDPLSQKEYYQLFAFLNNADEPDLELPHPQQSQLQNQIDRLESELLSHFPGGDKAFHDKFTSWLDEQKKQAIPWIRLRPSHLKGSLPHLTLLDDDSIFVTGDQSKSDTYHLEFQQDLNNITALRLEVLPDERLPKRGPGRVYYEGPHGDFFLSEISLMAAGKPLPIQHASHSFASGKHSAQHAIDGDPQTGWSIDGGQGRAHQAVFRLAKPFSGSSLQLRLLFERYHAAGLGRFRIWVSSHPDARQARDFPVELEALLADPKSAPNAQQHPQLVRHFLLTTPELAKARQPLDRLRKQVASPTTTLVLAERAAQPRPTYLHHRGEFLQPTQPVQPGVPEVLHPFPSDAPRNRLEFARWLLSPQNPLVARVTVNRHWASFFGQGIVPTLQDFGLQGDLPSHPELLDWLALEFIENGWSVKALHRAIVLSATYRQSSQVTPVHLAKDPTNRLLSRAPRVRLEAEVLRDLVLRSSGLLALQLGGPSVFPPQPPEVTTEGAYGKLDWKVSQGVDRYRRGLYTFMKRTAPYALFSTFDGPSGEVCLARREVSNTPLQALTMLNDQTILEASRELGRQFAREPGSLSERVRMLFRRVLTRSPSSEEVDLLVRFYQTQHSRFEKKQLDPVQLAGPADDSVCERAAWTTLARALFNLDETVTKE